MLQFNGALKLFGTLPALNGCTFCVRPGRLTGFRGPNGAGETTAMRSVFGLVALDAGSVLWRNSPIGPVACRGGNVRRQLAGTSGIERPCEFAVAPITTRWTRWARGTAW